MKTNDYIKYVMINVIGTYEPIEFIHPSIHPIQSIHRRKLKLYGHRIIHDNLSKTIHQGMVEGTRRRGRPTL